MNLDETAALLGMFGANWPNYEITDHTVRLWADANQDLNPQDALHGARDIIREDQWFPSIARLRDATERHAHATRNRLAEVRGLRPGGKTIPGPERFQAILEDLRAQLADRPGGKHKHAGKHPCPVCGGHQPKPIPDRHLKALP